MATQYHPPKGWNYLSLTTDTPPEGSVVENDTVAINDQLAYETDATHTSGATGVVTLDSQGVPTYDLDMSNTQGNWEFNYKIKDIVTKVNSVIAMYQGSQTFIDNTVPSSYGNYEPSWIDLFYIQPQDANGWTIPVIHPNAKVFYVSEAGDNTAAAAHGGYALGDFPDMFNPTGEVSFLSYGSAMSAMREGYPDVALLKRANTFVVTGEPRLRGGESGTKRSLITSYGTGAMPIVDSQVSGPLNKISGTSGFINFIGVRYTSSMRDKSSPNYVGEGNVTTNPVGFTCYSSSSDPKIEHVLIEGCVFDNLQYGVSLNSSYNPGGNKILRRNLFHNIYKADTGGGHPQGASVNGSALVEENNFVHCGWNYDNPVGQGVVSQYNHSMYNQYVTNAIFRNNITYDSSSTGFKFTSDTYGVIKTYNVSIYNNLFVGGWWGVEAGGNERGTRFQNTIMQGNVSIATNTHQYGGRTLARGLSIEDTDTSLAEANLFLHIDNPNISPALTYAVSVERESFNVTVRDNKSFIPDNAATSMYRDSSVTRDAVRIRNSVNLDPSLYVEPTRKVETFMTSIGETATLEAYSDLLVGQTIDNWDASLQSQNITDYLKAGYAYVADVIIGDQPTNASSFSGNNYTVEADFYINNELGLPLVEWFDDGVLVSTGYQSNYPSKAGGQATTNCYYRVTLGATVVQSDSFSISWLVNRNLVTFGGDNDAYAEVSTSFQGSTNGGFGASFRIGTDGTVRLFGANNRTDRYVTVKGNYVEFRAGSLINGYTTDRNLADGFPHTLAFDSNVDNTITLTVDNEATFEDVGAYSGWMGGNTLGTEAVDGIPTAISDVTMWDVWKRNSGITRFYAMDEGVTGGLDGDVVADPEGGTLTLVYRNTDASNWSVID